MSQDNFDRFVADNANALVRTAYLIVGDLHDGLHPAGIGGKEHGGSRLRKEAKDRMRHQRGLLLDGCADSHGERGLSQRHGDAAI